MKKMSLMFGAILFILAGCGQKGPLYLPQPAKPSPDAAQTVPAAANQPTDGQPVTKESGVKGSSTGSSPASSGN